MTVYIPEDIFIDICYFLPTVDMLNLATICKKNI